MKKDPRIFLGHILIHEYFGIDLELTWKAVKTDIPELKRRIREVKKNII